jgi:hypothetical protein
MVQTSRWQREKEKNAKMHLLNSASSSSIMVENLIHNPMIKGSNLPLAKGERKKCKNVSPQFCQQLEHSGRTPDSQSYDQGFKLAAGKVKEKMAKMLFPNSARSSSIVVENLFIIQ